jgi:hypothetical protein
MGNNFSPKSSNIIVHFEHVCELKCYIKMDLMTTMYETVDDSAVSE